MLWLFTIYETLEACIQVQDQQKHQHNIKHSLGESINDCKIDKRKEREKRFIKFCAKPLIKTYFKYSC